MQVFDMMGEIEKVTKDLDEAINNPDLSFDEAYKKIKKWLAYMQQEVKIVN